jgi:paraquat-inducible protein B
VSRKANPFLIGTFVLGAIALAVIGTLVVGSGKFFQKRPRCILYFEGSVNGLKVGAPVALRGVQIGEVSEIRLLASQKKLDFLIPVVIELSTSAVKNIDQRRDLEPHEYLDALVRKGLRAQLESQSFVTGMLFINLDFFPDNHPRFVDTTSDLPEIPTIPSKLEELSRALQSLPLSETMNRLARAIDAFNAIIDNEDARQLFPKLLSSLKQGESVFAQADAILKVFREHAGPAAEGLEGAAASASRAADQAEKMFAQAHSLVGDDSDLRYQSVELVKTLTRTLRALNSLADYLERNPNALIFGKKDSEEANHE